MIKSEKVSEIFRDCLYKNHEIVGGKPIVEPIRVEGIFTNFGLYPERVNQHSKDIEGFIDELPVEFEQGWSFLNLCLTKNGELWTGQHQTCEELMVLGMAIKKIQYCCPREMWSVLPNGLPYIQVIKS